MIIDNELKFETHMRNICEGATQNRGRSRTVATSKAEVFAILVNGFQPLTIITKCSNLDVAAVLDPPLIGLLNRISFFLDPEKNNNLYLMCISALIWICLKLSINIEF